MKKKLLLVAVIASLLVCALAVSASAAVTGSSSSEYGTVTEYDSIGAKDKLDTASRVVLVNADGTYSTYPAYYVLSNNLSASFDFSALNKSTGESYSNKSVVRIEFPNAITSIGGNMFNGCTALVEIDLPSALTTVNGGAFYNCTNLQYIDGTDGLLIFPEGFKSIGANNAFYNCDKIKYVEFPSTFTYLGQAAFHDCDGLLLVSFDKINEAISNGTRTSIVDFNNCGTFKYCDNLVALSIPELTTVAINRLATGCTNLTAVYMPDTIKQIGSNGNGQGAFDDCKNMYFVQESFTVSQCIVNGQVDLTKLDLPEKPSVYHMPASFVEFIGHVEINQWSKSGTIFRNCVALNDTIVFGESFVYFNANNAFQGAGTESAPKNIVFLADMTKYVPTQNCSYINFIFVNKNDKSLNDIGIINVHGHKDIKNSYMYFCASGTKYETASISKNMDYNAYNNAYNPVYNEEYEKAYAEVYDSCYQSAYDSLYQKKYDELINSGKTEDEAKAGAEEAVVTEAKKKADSSAKSTASAIATPYGNEAKAAALAKAIESALATGVEGTLHIHNAKLDAVQDATCELPAGKYTYCFCGGVISSEVVEGSEALGHDLSLENGAVDLGIVYVNFFAKGEHSYSCARCGEKCTEETEVLFVCKGYAVSTFGESFSMAQGFEVNNEAIANYMEYVPSFEFGLIAAGNKNNGEAFKPELSGDLCIPQGKIAHDYFDIKVTGITSSYLDSQIVFCAYVKADDTVYYLDNYVTSDKVAGISYNDVKALLG